MKTGFLTTLLILSIPYVAFTLSSTGFLALMPFVREEFLLTRTQVGYFSTCFFLSSAILAIFTGSAVDRVGPKKGFIFGIACLGFMNLMYGLSPSYTILLLFAFIAGTGQSIITPSANKAVMSEAPLEKRAFSMGIMQSGAGIGGLVGATLLPILGESFGWRISVQFTGFIVLLTGLVIVKYYNEKTSDNNPEALKNNELASLRHNLRFFLEQRQFLFLCLFGAIMAGSGGGAVLSHFPVFLSEDLQMSRASAGLGLGIFQVGGMMGRPFWGWLSDQFFRFDRKRALYLAGLVSGVMFLVPVFMFNNSHLSPWVVYLFSFLMGFSIFGWFGVFFVTIGEFAGSKRIGAASGLALLSNRIGILAAPPLFGLLADARGNYNLSWLLFGAVIIFVSIFLLLEGIVLKKKDQTGPLKPPADL